MKTEREPDAGRLTDVLTSGYLHFDARNKKERIRRTRKVQCCLNAFDVLFFVADGKLNSNKKLSNLKTIDTITRIY